MDLSIKIDLGSGNKKEVAVLLRSVADLIEQSSNRRIIVQLLVRFEKGSK